MTSPQDHGDDEDEPGAPPPIDVEPLGPAPGVSGRERIRGDVRARLFGNEPDAPEPPDDKVDPLGPTPEVSGHKRIHDDVRARLFGNVPDNGAASSEADVEVEVDADADASATGDGASTGQHRIGRFVVLERLGRGGMGVVYRAHDPKLDRAVAIKLLRPDVHGAGEADAQARLLREAQAMARLSDPNVIMVHEVGTVGDRVFVAMEYVEGPTLRKWLKDERSPREILRAFVAAGQGLAAAHRAGLVHRDFKPDNVLVDRDERVRVLDFGLARAEGAPESSGSATPSKVDPQSMRSGLRSGSGSGSLSTPLTRTGAVMGTPAYMSPEQLLGHPADARSDQFSFCVALWEGLTGQRPFAGDTLPELSLNVVAGRLQTPSSDARIPRRVLAALRRGLSTDPNDRFGSMEELLVPLRHRPVRRWQVGAVLLVGALASTATLALRGDDAAEACTGLSDQLAGIWDDATRAQVDEAIRGTARPFAPQVSETTLAMLDDYANRWVNLAEEACGAALVAGHNDDESRRREDCLDQRRVELGALVEALRDADEGMVHAAVSATADLTAPSLCSDPRRLADRPIEDDPAVRERVAQARAQLARAKAKGALGRYEDAVSLASAVIEQAQQLSSGSLEAMGRMTRGTYRERTGDSEGAEADLRAAIDLAQLSRDPETRAQAMVRLVWVIGQDKGRYDEARAMGIQAGAVLDLIDAPALQHASLDNHLGTISRIAGALDEAREYHGKALARRREVLGEDHPDVGRSLTNLGNVLTAQGELAEAEDHLRRGLTLAVQTLGPDHPTVAAGRTGLAFCLSRRDKPSEAITEQHRALEVYERAFGAEHPSSLHARYNLGQMARNEGWHREAIALLGPGLRLLPGSDAEDPSRFRWLAAVGHSELMLGHRDAAGHLERAYVLMQSLEYGDRALAPIRFHLARAVASDDAARAEQLATQARDALAGTKHDLHEQIETWLRGRAETHATKSTPDVRSDDGPSTNASTTASSSSTSGG